MILSNVNIGTGPSAGDGDPLRSAFITINNNFQLVTNNVNALSNSVTSVAGRTGNIILTVNDVIGAASVAYVNSQVGNVGSYSNINVTAFLPSYAGSIATVTNANLAMKGYVDARVASLVDSAPSTLDTLNELAAALGDDPNLSVTLTNTIASANTTMKAYVDGQISAANTLAYSNVNTLSYLTTNSYATQAYVDQANTIQSAQVNAANLAIVAANLGMKGYVDSVATLSSYGNANVASYLPNYGGNVSVGNIIFDDLSVQTTAYTGTQWRSNLSSNVRVKPSWLSYVPGGKNQEGVQYGFDAGGMFFSGNANNDFAYPIQYGLHFHEQDVLEVIATLYFGATNNDHGLSIFSADTRPIWRSSTDSSRIAFQFDVGIPVLYGQTTANTAPGSPILSPGNYYTIKFTYDPTNTVTVETFSGNTASGSPLDSRSINEVLPAGDYKVGFDADNDASGVKSYWTNLIVRTLTNTVVNDLEVQGQVTGNLIPSANVTYSLGSITSQWKDLFVSNTTIYLGGTPVSITDGSLTVNGNAVGGTNLVTYSGNVGASSITLDGATGPIGNVKVLNGGNGFTMFGFFAGAGGSGSGFSVVPQGSSLFDPVQINTRGTGYRVGDVITIVNTNEGNGYSNASVVVTSLQNQPAPSIFVGNSAYKFGADGNIVLPAGGGILDSTGASVLGSDYSNVGVATYLPTYSGNIAANIAKAGYIWTFGTDGNITFPDSTVQSTAWLGSAAEIDVTDTNGLTTVYYPTFVENRTTGQTARADVNLTYRTDDNILGVGNIAIGASGNITFPDNTVQTTAYTGGGSYGNAEVATYLPTYTGNVAAGNVLVTSAYRFASGAVTITNESNNVVLTPDTGADALAGVRINGNGYLLGPNGSRNITLNYNGVGGAVGLQGNVTVGTAGSGNLWVMGNVIARDVTASNILASGTSGKIGFSSGGFAQQATSNSTQVTSHFTSGNIQLMSIDLGASAAHTVPFSCNKLTTNDILVVKHVSGGLTSVYVDAYVQSDGLAIIWMRDITGNGTGAFTPMLKYAIIRAPSS